MFASKDLFFTNNSGGYQISRSVRLRSSASAYLNRTPASAGSLTTWTWSAWVKRGTLGSAGFVFGAGTVSSNDTGLYFETDNTLIYQKRGSINLQTSQVFRDTSAWYHVVVVLDSTQGTSSNRLKMYVNGVQVTSFATATYPTSSETTQWNNSTASYIGRRGDGVYFDGYLTELNFIDGQALTPSSFGQTNTVTGVWQPIKYTGTYGTNGFYLNFSDNSNNTATTIGKDYSGNGNNWTPNNISVTAGVTYDSMLDVPTLTSATAANFAVYNPLKLGSGGTWTVTNGNLSASNTGSGSFSIIASSIGMSSNKWYFEFTATNAGAGANLDIGVLQDWNTALTTVPTTSSIGQFATGYAYTSNGVVSNNNTNGSTYSTYTTNDVIQVALDLDNNKVYFGKNGTWQNSGNPAAGTGSIYTVTAGTYFAAIGRTSVSSQTASATANFGQQPFTYTPPTGFVALNTQNLPTPTISNGANYMAATLWNGNSSTQNISNAVNGISFQPDFVWIKKRNGVDDHGEFDSVRGVQKRLQPNLTNAENTETTALSSFDSGGFTLGTNGQFNGSTFTYVGWQWKAGTTSSSNTNGSITSTVSANPTAGFSVVTYTGTGATGATVGHGLGAVPQMIIVKNRSAAAHWPVGHVSLPSWAYNLYLSLTNAQAVVNTSFNSTTPTSTVFTLGPSGGETNFSGQNFVAYCFTGIAGYSKFGSYTGNGSTDGPFVFTNFQPRWVMVKRTDSTSDWYIWDTSRDTYNVETATLLADTAGAETSATSIDGLSNGFKCRSATVVNVSGGTYIFAAFASNPYKLSLAR
jgi:hypothetical protein